MKIQVVTVADCPNAVPAVNLTRAALDATGHPDVAVELVELTSAADAAAISFAGSPTILINGSDAFPDAERTGELSCRTYTTAAGFAGLPAQADLESALRSQAR